MHSDLRKKILGWITATGLTLGAGFGIAPPNVPEPLIVELLDDVACEEWPSEDLESLLRSLAGDPRRRIRRRLALLAGRLTAEAGLRNDAEILHELVRGSDSPLRESAAHSLAALLAKTTPLEQLHIACQWATDPVTGVRATLARALAAPLQIFGGDLVLAHLSSDESSVVRRAVGPTLRSHAEREPAVYGPLLAAVRHDPDRLVRRAARGRS